VKRAENDVPTVRPPARSYSDADFPDESSNVYMRSPRTPTSAVFRSPCSEAGGFDAKLAWVQRRLAAGFGTPRLHSLCSAAQMRHDEVLLDSLIAELTRR